MTEELSPTDEFHVEEGHKYVVVAGEMKSIHIWTSDKTRAFHIVQTPEQTIVRELTGIQHEEEGAIEQANKETYTIEGAVDFDVAWRAYRLDRGTPINHIPPASAMLVGMVEVSPDGIPNIRPTGAPPIDEVHSQEELDDMTEEVEEQLREKGIISDEDDEQPE